MKFESWMKSTDQEDEELCGMFSSFTRDKNENINDKNMIINNLLALRVLCFPERAGVCYQGTRDLFKDDSLL